MIVGCYTLDLYCDKKERHTTLDGGRYYLKVDNREWIYLSNQFTGETYGSCLKQARKEGWIVNRNKDKCLCKYCKKG